MTRKQAIIITSLSLASILLALLISARLWFRVDMTANKAYTISPVSRSLWQDIDNKVKITYYISEKLKAIHPVPGEIEDLLREYAAYSHGKIEFTAVDPNKTGLADSIAQLGIAGQQIQTVEKDQATVSIVYTGILLEYLDTMAIIPVVFSLDTLEYDITTRIRALVRGTEREAGIIVGDTGKTLENSYNYLNQVLNQSGFRSRVITPGAEIPSSLSCLLVLGGVEELDDWALYRIDHYIQNGGRVLFASDSFSVDLQYGINVRQLSDGGLLELLRTYGAEVKPALALDRSAQTTTVQSQSPTGIPMIRVIRYPFWVAVLEQGGNTAHPVTSNFEGVDLYWPSPLELNAPPGIEAAPLFTSTETAWLQTRNFNISPEQEYLWMSEMETTAGTKILAAALSGVFPRHFTSLAKPVREGSGEELPDMPVTASTARIIVTGDTDFLTDAYNQRDMRNMSFLIEAADWLSNDDDIIGIRNRAPQTGRLDKIIDEERRAAAMVFARFLNMALIPLAVVIAGIVRAQARRAASKGAKKESVNAD